MKHIAKLTLAFCALPLIQGCNHQQEPVRPNIILIMADDMGYSDIGCYGGEISTPNLDHLASNGLRFTQFYNAARCCPTRASLLTGLYPHQTGIGLMTGDLGFPSYRGDLNENCVTIAQVLGNNGYSTYMSGKWHVTKHVDQWRYWKPEDEREYISKYNWPLQRGFNKFYGTIHGAGSYYNPASLVNDNTPVEPEKEDYYYTNAISEHAVQYINEHSGNSNPFFLYVAYTAPHWPLHALPEDIAKYNGIYDDGWDKIREQRMAKLIEMGIIDKKWELSPPDPRKPKWTDVENKEWEIACMEVYAAMVDRMDQGIGTIIETLKQSGQFENTLIFFLADNGGCAEELSDEWPLSLHVPDKQRDGSPIIRGNDSNIMPGPEKTFQSYGLTWANVSNTPFRYYKHYIHEGGISTPLIVHWPNGIKAKNELRNQVGDVKDIMATCLDVADVEYPKVFNSKNIIPLEGKSLFPAFENTDLGINPLFWEHEGNRGARSGEWKLVAVSKSDWELYNLKEDRTELNNVAAQFPDKVNELEKMYSEWAEKCGVQPWLMK